MNRSSRLLGHTSRLGLLLLALPLAGVAQEEAPSPWNLTVELGFDGTRGNRDFYTLRSSFSAKRETETSEFEFSAGYRWGESGDRTIAKELRGGLKFDLYPQADWSPFIFVNATQDEIRKWDLRSENGAGVKWTFARGEDGKASISNALLYEVQRFTQDAASTQVGVEDWRWSLRIKGEQDVGNASLEHITFWQPLWDRTGDFLIEATTSISTPVVGGLDLVVRHSFTHDETPAPGVLRDDQRLSVVFRLRT